MSPFTLENLMFDKNKKYVTASGYPWRYVGECSPERQVFGYHIEGEYFVDGKWRKQDWTSDLIFDIRNPKNNSLNLVESTSEVPSQECIENQEKEDSEFIKTYVLHWKKGSTCESGVIPLLLDEDSMKNLKIVLEICGDRNLDFEFVQVSH